jgi:hypothetical protein
VALTKRTNLIQQVQTTFPRGIPFDHKDLAEVGVSSALAHHYFKFGWLVRLGRGVFMFPNDMLREEECLKFLARHWPGLHVGGKTALAWRGVRQNLVAQEPLWLWGEKKARLPVWFNQRFRAQYTARNPFDPAMPNGLGLQPLPETPEGVLVSVPERAVLEMLSEVGIHHGIEESRNIMEGVRSLRPEVLAMLLSHCQRIKVVRLCVLWAEELNLSWAKTARQAAGKKIGQSRWTSQLKDGTTLILKT